MSKPDSQIREQVAVSPPGAVVYQAIYQEGEHELKRGAGALGLSGLAAGLSMGFSFLGEALLRELLPAASCATAISKLGYTFGFVIVILGRQQLFSKTTLTVILPLLEHAGKKPTARLSDVAKLWAVVAAANLAGAAIFAGLVAWRPLFPEGVRTVFARIGAEEIGAVWYVMLVRAILAGWLIALMIWLLPFAETSRVWVITLIAYLVGIAHFPHVVAGSVPALYAVLIGQSSFLHFLTGFLLPTLAGNAIGGVALVSAGAYAEFVHEGKRKGA